MGGIVKLSPNKHNGTMPTVEVLDQYSKTLSAGFRRNGFIIL